MFQDETESVRITKDFLQELPLYQTLPDGLTSHEKCKIVLKKIGIDTYSIGSVKGYVRHSKDKTKVYKTKIYTGVTTKQCQYKGLFENVQVVVSDNIESSRLKHIDELYVEEEIVTNKRQVRNRKFKESDLKDFEG